MVCGQTLRQVVAGASTTMSISYPPVEITIVTVSMNDIFVPGRLRRSVSVTCALWPGPTESTAGSRSSESGLKER